MEIIYPLVMKVIALSILSCLVEYILPQGSVKKSAVKAIGLITLVSIAEPVISALNSL